ncbi:MAG: hypothetical protein RJB11_359 [Planctomycetota bacterium]
MTPVGHQTRIPGGRYHFLAVGYGLNETSPKWIGSRGPAYLIPLGPLSLLGPLAGGEALLELFGIRFFELLQLFLIGLC